MLWFIGSQVKPRNWNVQILQFKPNLEYSDTFWQLLKYDLFNFIIICKKENLHRIMKWVCALFSDDF